MQNISIEELDKVNEYMGMQYKKHKKIMFRTWLFIILYTFFIFIIFTQYVYDNMFVELDFYFIKIWYDLRGAFWLLTLFYLSFCNIKLSIKKVTWCKIDIKLLFDFLKNYYILFNFFLIWPALFVAVSDFPILWNFWKILLWVSPFLFYILRIFIVDFIWSDKFVRWFFRWKDVEVWSCPWCHEYILRKPIFYCPNCGNIKHGERWLCRSCGLSSKILDFDFPNFCPHCGLWFKYKHLKPHSKFIF